MPDYTATPSPKPLSVKCVRLGDERSKIHYAGTEAMPLTVMTDKMTRRDWERLNMFIGYNKGNLSAQRAVITSNTSGFT